MRIVQLTTDNREQQNDYANPLPRFGTAPEALLEGFSEMDSIEVHVVSCVRKRVAIPPPLYGKIHYHAVEVPKIGWMSSAYLGCIRGVRNIIKDINPDIVHGQGTERDCAMTAVYSGKPNVLTIHGNMAELNRLGETFQSARLYGHLASLLESHALNKTYGTLCNSAYTESLVEKRCGRTWLVPNAIRKEFFRPSSSASKSDVPTLINIGLISPRKRQLELLIACKNLWSRGLKFKIMFIGGLSKESSYGKMFYDELHKSDVKKYASHEGFLNLDELISTMDRSHAMIHCPSEEAFGLVVAEALARNLKFFGTDVGGIRDITESIDSAELYPSIDSLINGVGEWLSSGHQSPFELIPTIKSKYHPLIVAQSHVRIYQELINHQ